MSALEKILRRLVRLYPEEFRQAHEAELLEYIEAESRRFRTFSIGGARFFFSTASDLVASAVRLRWRARRSRPTSRRRSSGTRSIGHDLRHSARSLLATPSTSLLIVLTLAAGIGLDTAIFSVVDRVLFAPLPYKDADRLYFLNARWTTDGVDRAHHTGRDFDALRRDSEAFEDIAAVTSIRQNLVGAETPLQVQVGWASRNLFDLLGVSPTLGPGFTSDAPPGTLVLSYELWQSAFGGAEDVAGRVVRLDDHPYTITGVLPRGFVLELPRFSPDIDVWKVPDDWWQNGDAWTSAGLDFAILDLIGRLDHGATWTEAREELDGFAVAFREARPEYARAGLEYDVVPLREAVVGELRPQMLLLLGAVAIVLLVACANVASLMLARACARDRELGLRLALGASRWRLARLLIVEALLLASAGGSAGVLLALAAEPALRALAPQSLPRLDAGALQPGLLVFALALSMGAALLFGVIPAWTAAKTESSRPFRGGARSTEPRERKLLARWLVAAQLSSSVVLWIGAALLSASLVHLAEIQPGFDSEDVLTFSVSLPGTKYERPVGTDRFFRELESRIEALPGVRAAGVVWPLPFSGRFWSNTYVAGNVRELDRAYAEYRVVTPGFFDTMNIPLLEGRNFSSADPRRVALVSHTLAERAFPGESAVGRTIRANPWGGDPEEFEILGVTADVRFRDLRKPPEGTLYFDSRGWSWTDWDVDFVVRTQGAPERYVAPIREILTALDGTVPLARPRPMADYVSAALAPNRFALSLIGLFAGVAGLLAVVGLYGLLSHAVTQSRREIGIRIALGSDRRGILRWVYRKGAGLIAVGIGVGLLGALALSRFLESLLVGIEPTDAVTYASVCFALALAGTLACYIPARRASRVEPISVIRDQ